MGNVEPHPCGPGTSFFRFIDEYWKGSRPAFTLHRLCTLMRKMAARTLVHECLDKHSSEWPRIERELGAIRKRIGKAVPAQVLKLTYMTCDLDDMSRLGEVPEEQFIGYAILINLQLGPDDWFSYVFEAVFREPGFVSADTNGEFKWKPLLNNYLHVRRTFRATVAQSKEYEIAGSFFCQQNGITSVCAHACATMVLNNSTGGDRLLTCEDINETLAIDHEKRKLQSFVGGNDLATHEGLTTMELMAVFRRFGFASYTHDFLGENRRLYRDFIYGFVESGFPAVLAFTTLTPDKRLSRHVVPVFGHTLNSDSWFPTAFVDYAQHEPQDKEYLSTLDWVADFIIHDDNFGPYFCLPGHCFRPEGRPDFHLDFIPHEGIGIYPAAASVKMLGYVAESLGFYRFRQLYEAFVKARAIPVRTYYVQHLLPHVDCRTAVVRATLVTAGQYLEHMRNMDNEANPLSKADRHALGALVRGKTYLWLIEISEPDLYIGNKSKVVDVVLDPMVQLDPKSAETSLNTGVIVVRFPGFLLKPEGDGYKTLPFGFSGHVPLFTFGETRPPETVW